MEARDSPTARRDARESAEGAVLGRNLAAAVGAGAGAEDTWLSDLRSLAARLRHGLTAAHVAAAANDVPALQLMASRGLLAGSALEACTLCSLEHLPSGLACLRASELGAALARRCYPRGGVLSLPGLDLALVGLTPLQLAAACGATDAAAWLLGAGADPLAPVAACGLPPHALRAVTGAGLCLVGGTALLAAALSGSAACFRVLLAGVREAGPAAPPGAAAATGPPEATQARAFDPSAVTASGRTLLHLAALAGSLEVASAALKAGCPPDAPDGVGHPICGQEDVTVPHTPLLEAVAQHDEQMVCLLLAAGAGLGRSLHVALQAGAPASMVDLLAAAGAPVSDPAGTGLTPLHTALRTLPANAYVPQLLRLGADPNAVASDYGVPCTPLQMACMCYGMDVDHASIIPALLGAGAKPHLRTNGAAALHHACHSRNLPALCALLPAAGLGPAAGAWEDVEAEFAVAPAELDVHGPHPAFDAGSPLDLALKGFLQASPACPSHSRALWLHTTSHLHSPVLAYEHACAAADCIELLRAHGAPPASEPALAAVRVLADASAGGVAGRMAEQVWLAAAAPRWSPAVHRMWPPAFQDAARELLLLSNAARRGGGARSGAAAPGGGARAGAGAAARGGVLAAAWGPHECEEILHAAAYPLSAWLQAGWPLPSLYRAQAEDAEVEAEAPSGAYDSD
eukprot:scaffold10.g2390.t1